MAEMLVAAFPSLSASARSQGLFTDTNRPLRRHRPGHRGHLRRRGYHRMRGPSPCATRGRSPSRSRGWRRRRGRTRTPVPARPVAAGLPPVAASSSRDNRRRAVIGRSSEDEQRRAGHVAVAVVGDRVGVLWQHYRQRRGGARLGGSGLHTGQRPPAPDTAELRRSQPAGRPVPHRAVREERRWRQSPGSTGSAPTSDRPDRHRRPRTR